MYSSKKTLNILSILVLVILTIFSFEFYYKIHFTLMILMVTCEISVWAIIPTFKMTNVKYLKVLAFIVILASMVLSLIGFVSNGYKIINDNTDKQYKVIDNEKYDKYIEKSETLKNEITGIENSIKNMGTLEEYIKNAKIPSWENKNGIISEYNKIMEDKNNELKESRDELKALTIPDKKIKVKTENSGFDSLNIISEKLNTTKDKIVLTLFFGIGILLQVLSFTLRSLSSNIKENVKTDVKTDVKTEDVKTNVKTLKKPTPYVGIVDLKKKDVKTNVKTNVQRKNVLTLANVQRKNVKTFGNVQRKNVLTHIVKTYKDGEAINVKTLKEKFGLSARVWQRIRNECPELETKGTNTYYKAVDKTFEQ